MQPGSLWGVRCIESLGNLSAGQHQLHHHYDEDKSATTGLLGAGG